jgi:methionyl-tRNA formyltransferase
VKVLFFGTDSISKDYLEELYKNNHKIFVITMPDRPASRGQFIKPSLVKVYAVENNIDFIQPEMFINDVVETIKKFSADVGVVISYGKFIPKVIFDLPRHKTFNIHFSLLPKYRGASPVQYALCNGEIETGVTSFYIEEKLDAGNIIIQEKLSIDIKDNSKVLFNKLIPLGIYVMNRTLELFQNGKHYSTPQIGELSFAPIFKKEEGLVNWNKSAKEIYNRFRGLYIWPGIYSLVSKGKLSGKRIKFIDIEVFENNSVNRNFGVVHSMERYKGFIVSCAIGKILVTKIKPENRSVMSAWSFIQGEQFTIGDRF